LVRIPRSPHSWSVDPRRAIAIQQQLAARVVRRGRLSKWRYVAGADLAFSEDGPEAIAGVVLWDAGSSSVIEEHVVRRPVSFPYVPGLLSFREAPAILAALRKLRIPPDVLLLDGQGYAHPRRFGLACHVSLIADLPGIGCAKSLLVGSPGPLGLRRGATSPIRDDGECVGMAVRTRDGVKPVYVSVGHRVSLDAAVEVTLACGGGYRVPEPTRLADQLVARAKRA
jgi:deoxyribonuclease V